MSANDGRYLPTVSVATLIITYKCPVACPMCFLACSPYRKDVMSNELADEAITQFANYGIPFLGIAGGEPFLRKRRMYELIERALAHKITPIVVTNAYWATSEQTAKRELKHLYDIGLRWIQISLDDQHQMAIPIERVANAVKAASILGFEDIKLLGSSKGNTGRFKYQIVYLHHVFGVDISKLDLVDRPRVSHRYFMDAGQERCAFEQLEAAATFKSTECLTEWMLDVNGDLYPCCNNFIGKIGNLRVSTVEEMVMKAGQNPYIKILRDSGPPGLARYMDASCGTDVCHGQYESWCGLCAKMFQNERFSRIMEM